MKLMPILKEIQVLNISNPYVLSPKPSDLQDPDENDTMRSWLKKNNLQIKYTNSARNGVTSIKGPLSYGLVKGFWSKVMGLQSNNDWRNDISNPQIIAKYKQLVITPIKNTWQKYFDKICGPGRVKVSFPSNINANIRLIINEPPGKFKMKSNGIE